ncbi:hypothetical protein KC669_01695 [Candidatus Dojkabacteria bacterium]|uniref:Uncharacterized protein n=1 Tax=Candidatus Dojkabacteria bacterium TaxID=2099670 RepID=A0A955RLI3_9BACT|nr:hypothetical protein [Candidatus Dojkabacteria bacterium]
MNKIFLVLAFTCTILLGSIIPVRAIQLDGETEIDVGDTTVIELLANPKMANATTAQISLGLDNQIKALEYVPPLNPTWAPEIGTCEDNDLFKEDTICVDLIKLDGFIETGESLGIFVVEGVSKGQADIFGFSDNGYKDTTDSFEKHSGLLYKINVAADSLPTTGGEIPSTPDPYAPPTTSIPDTAIFIKDNTMFKAFLSFMLALTLAIFAIVMQYVNRKEILAVFENYIDRSRIFWFKLKEEEKEYKKDLFANKVLNSKQYKDER